MPFLRLIAIALAIVYAGWNLLWLCQAKIPPSLFLALTGLPCPTTGCSRAVACLFAGNWRGSLSYNPMTVPITGLFLASLIWLSSQAFRGRQLRLPAHFLPLWLWVLAIAWIVQLARI